MAGKQFKSALEEKLEQAHKGKRAPGKQMLMKDAQGQLVSVQPRSSQEAAQALGQQTPTTPLGVSQMGMGADSAKMAGVPAQKQAALQQMQPDGVQTLQQARRTEQARTEATEEERQKLEKSQHLQNLGSLGDQVHRLISGEFDKLETSRLQATGEGVAALPETIEEALAMDPSDPNRQVAIQGALADWANNLQAAGGQVNFQDILQMFGDPQEAIAQMAQAGLQDQLVVDDQLLQGLGYAGMEQFALDTGIEIPEGTTLQEFQGLVQQSIDQEFAETERLQSVMNDPFASAQDRAAARQQLIDIGALGLRGAEVEAHQIEQQVAEADDIQIAGETVSLEQALSDEYLSSLVKRAMDDPELMAKIQEENPGFAAFINQNQELLSGLAGEVEESVEALEERKELQREVAEVPGLGNLDDETLQLLGIDLDEYGTELKQLPDWPVLGLLKNESLPADQRANLMDNFQELGKLNPDQLALLGSLDEGYLREIGALEPGGGELGLLVKGLRDPASLDGADAFALRAAGNSVDNLHKLPVYRHNYTTRVTFGRAPDKWLSKDKKAIIESAYQKYPKMFKDGKIDDNEARVMTDKELKDYLGVAGNVAGKALVDEIARRNALAKKAAEDLADKLKAAEAFKKKAEEKKAKKKAKELEKKAKAAGPTGAIGIPDKELMEFMGTPSKEQKKKLKKISKKKADFGPIQPGATGLHFMK